ncbi:MAG: oligosaccharide flippase family protein [Candidatus Omnitrophica bacterium]|nr:oligosaccharide flippase family protein [Candidatus Omnitrophota bacterium]
MAKKQLCNRENIVRNASIFSGGVYISQILFFVRGFLNAKILGPGLYGLWSGLNIILNYSAYARLGSLNAMNREIPYQNGRCSDEDMGKTRNVAFTIALVTSFIFSFSLVVIAFLLRQKISFNELAGFVTIALIAFIFSIFEFYQTVVIALKKFTVITKANIWFAFLSVGLTLAIVPRFNIYGVYIVAILIPLLTLVYLVLKEPCKVSLCFDFKEMLRLINIGLPLGVINFLDSSVINVPSIIVLALLGKVSLGYYSVAMLATRFLTYFPNSIHRTFEPYIYQRYGQTNDILELKKYLFKPIQVMVLLFPVIIGVYYMTAAFFIRHFLAKYIAAICPFFIISIGIFFISFAPTSNAFITAMNKQKFLIPVYLSGIVIGGLSSLVFINKGYGVTASALGLLFSFFFIGAVIFIYAVNHYVKSAAKCLAYLAGLCAPIIYITTIVFFSEIAITNAPGIFSDSLRLVARLAVLLIFSAPLIYIAENKTGIVSDILGFLKIKRSEI